LFNKVQVECPCTMKLYKKKQRRSEVDGSAKMPDDWDFQL
jgi:hypothetical protein